jgi:hypothetical protein
MAAMATPVPGSIVYRVGGTLPSVPTNAVVYRADATTTPARVARLAEALGVGSSVVQDTSGWSVQGTDRSLRVQAMGGLPWTLSSSRGAIASSGCAVASHPSTGGSGGVTTAAPVTPPPTCPTTTTVPGLPNKADAEQRARAVLTTAGFDLTGATTQSTGSTTAWYVTFSPTLAGLPVLGGQWSVTVGAYGSVVAATGKLADPVNVGDYPLVGLDAGVQRLQQGGRWIIYSGPVPMLGAVAQGSTATTGSAVAGGGITAVASTTTAPSSVPPVVVTITGVHLAVAWAWPLGSSSPNAWLVPVYVFELAGGTAYPYLGNQVPVLAVADQYVAAPPSTLTTTGATTPAGTATPAKSAG